MIQIQQLTDGIKNNLTCVKCSSSDSTLAAKELCGEIGNEFYPEDNKKKLKLHGKFKKYYRTLNKISPRLHLTDKNSRHRDQAPMPM